MSKVTAHNGDVFKGVLEALTATVGNYDLKITFTSNSSSNTINFVLSDGEVLYLFRNADDDAHQLAWEDNQANLFTVKTQGGLSHPLNQFDFICIPRYGDPTVLSNFLNPTYELVSGTISDDNWSGTVYITDDATVPAGHTLNINGTVKFATHAVLTINGTVNLNAGAEIYLENSSTILIEDDPALFLLNWGSKISGRVHTTYESIPPGGNAGGERAIPGDRIIARNGGIILTHSLSSYDPGDPVVEITSHGDYNWDGIYIENPDQDDNFWFVNCDISGIQNLSIRNGLFSTPDKAHLELHHTNMHQAGQVLVMDGHNLHIDECSFTNNNRTPISVYGCPVVVENTDITDNNGNGLSIRYATEEEIKVENCLIQNNSGDGVHLSGNFVKFNENDVYSNGRYGIVSGMSNFDEFKSNEVINNGSVEYLGFAAQYDISVDQPQNMNTIRDDASSGGFDLYVLAAVEWDGVDHSIPVYGNNILPQGHDRYYPCWEAFDFDGPGLVQKQALDTAFSEMDQGNYDNADLAFKAIIQDYVESDQAVVAARALYYIQNYSAKDYPGLRDYLVCIDADDGGKLQREIEDVITKSYMHEEEYVTAIQRLEAIIADPPSEDAMLLALIDQAYCYFQLADKGDALPQSCSVTPVTLNEFQNTVMDLELRLFAFDDSDELVSGTEFKTTIRNYPNPFNPTTTIAFDLPISSNVELTIFNIAGQKVKTLLDEYRKAGSHELTWNGVSATGQAVASGIYFYRLKAGGETATGKMLLLK